MSIEPGLVTMVSVLDVLGQPILGPVDFLTTNSDLEIIQDYPELVMLHLVVHTVVLVQGAVSLLIVLDVIPHSLLECGQEVGIFWVLRYGKDLGKQHIMLLIKSSVLKG